MFDMERQNVKSHVAFGNGHRGGIRGADAFERIFAQMTNLSFAEGNDFHDKEAVIFRGSDKLLIEFDRLE